MQFAEGLHFSAFHFTSTGAWDVYIKNVLDNGRRKVNQLHSVISNRDINLSAHRLLLLAVVRPTLEYGGEAIRLRQLLPSFSLTSLSLSSDISDQLASTSSVSISYPTKNWRDRGCSLRKRDQGCRRKSSCAIANVHILCQQVIC